MDNPFLDPQWAIRGDVFLGVVAVLALLVGSFLNVVIYRLPVMMDRAWRRDCKALSEEPALGKDIADEHFSLVLPPSTCPDCGHRIRPWENIPVVSYIALRARCSACGTRISIRYPVIEILACVLSVAVAWRFGLQPLTIAALVVTWALLALTVIDIDHQLLPDSITMPLLWLGLILNSAGLFAPLQEALWGAVAGYLCLWSVYWSFKLVTGKEGMGYGDFKLLAALGAWLGWKAIPEILLVSSFFGAATGLSLMLLGKRDRNTPIPFGPFLAGAGWVMLLMHGTGHSVLDIFPATR